jgi:hypothetical protein
MKRNKGQGFVLELPFEKKLSDAGAIGMSLRHFAVAK